MNSDLIIQNSKGEVLLYLRDDKENLSYPNQWAILGGEVEENETPEQTIKREMKEEIEFDPDPIFKFREYDTKHGRHILFYTFADLNIDETPLHEGQKIDYFSWDEIQKMNNIIHFDRKILLDFFQRDKIGLVGGTFDLLHKGHVGFMKRASRFCDYLIVAVNSDELIQSRRGKYLKRPIRPWEQRKYIVENLSFVDKVISQDVFNPLPMLKENKVDVYILEEGHREQEYMKDFWGEVKVIWFPFDGNTTKTIQEILKKYEK